MSESKTDLPLVDIPDPIKSDRPNQKLDQNKNATNKSKRFSMEHLQEIFKGTKVV